MAIATTSFRSINPATGESVWEGHETSLRDVDYALQQAAHAYKNWANAPIQGRIDAILRFGQVVRARKGELTETITLETGRPLWDSQCEVDELLQQITASIDAFYERATERILCEEEGVQVSTQCCPHGVVAVIASSSQPAHHAHSHIIPSLLVGNTVLYKPSTLTPRIGELLGTMWDEVDLPQGALSLLQGGPRVVQSICQHPALDALFFTGTTEVGQALLAELPPELMVSLAMSANNPLIVFEVESLQAAAYSIVESAFLSSGQRCRCARRLIIREGQEGDRVLDHLYTLLDQLQVGPPTDRPEPFMGPLISAKAARRIILAQADLLERGGKPLRKLQQNGAFVTPGLIEMAELLDEEIFGPLLQVIRVPNFHAALHEANRTEYGLTAGLLSDNPALYQHLRRSIRAGQICWNVPLTCPSLQAPFGGIGRSGNHHPGGRHACDAAGYPTVSIEQRGPLRLPEQWKPGVTL